MASYREVSIVKPSLERAMVHHHMLLVQDVFHFILYTLVQQHLAANAMVGTWVIVPNTFVNIATRYHSQLCVACCW